MKLLGRLLISAAVAALLAAIWAPGPWWSWLLTAIVLLFAGAALIGPTVPDETYDPHTGHLNGELLPADVAHELINNARHPTERPDHDTTTTRGSGRSYGRKADDQ